MCILCNLRTVVYILSVCQSNLGIVAKTTCAVLLSNGFKVAKLMDVIVIGSGAAGVAALRRLHDAGLNVMALEAADRIGGRIQTVEFGANAVDIGAAWCHGEKDNVVFELANPLDLIGRPEPGHNWHVQSNGALVPEDISGKISSAISEEVDKADKKTGKGISECIRKAATTNPILKQYPELAKSFIESYEHMNHVGGQDDPSRGKSLRGLEEHWFCEGEFMLNWKGKGYKTILDVLLNKYPDPSKAIPVQILLNKEVENIRWGSRRSSQPGLDAINPLVQVKCTDGSLYIAKSVIVTVSIGVLQARHAQLFNPPLPANKVTTINSLELAVLDKIYIEFTKPWWPKNPGSFVILWRDEDKAEFSQDEQWITEIFGLDTVAHQPNVLLAWIYGKGAEAMEKVSLAGVHAGVNKLLNTVLRKQFDVAPIKNVVRSQWASNPFARGAYAYRTVATEQKQNGGNGAILLSEPLYHADEFPVVCFAGEATSHHQHNAVHGAVESGFREADRLIDCFKRFSV